MSYDRPQRPCRSSCPGGCLFFRLRQRQEQPLEVFTLVQHVEILVLRQVRGVFVARLDGLLKQFHRAVGVALFLVGGLAAQN